MSSFYATNKEVKRLSAKLDLLNTKLDSAAEGDLRVQLSGTLTELEQAKELLEAISGKDFATQTTLAAVLAKLADLESELATIKANQLSGDQKVQQVGTIPVIYISRLEDRPSATEVEIGQFVILTDEELSTWVSNGVNWVEVL